MPKRFSCEDEPNEFMDMPCRCDCGKWFDLLDGYSSKNSNKVVCEECYAVEKEAEGIRDRIDALSDEPGKKREINKLKKRLRELEG